MSTITQEQHQGIAKLLETCYLPTGVGSGPERACSIAAINLALTGKLTDAIPECMSPVIGRWIIRIQDAMPDDMRNSCEWKSLLPFAAGTGRTHETERKAVVMDWMWGTVLPQAQEIADNRGFGAEWKLMCDERTQEAALNAKSAADDSYAAAADDSYAAVAVAADAAVAVAADAAVAAAVHAAAAADAAVHAAAAADAAVHAAAAADAAVAVAAVAVAVVGAPSSAARTKFWESINPPALLQKLIDTGV